MRTLHWFFLVALALFVGGIGFIIAAARMARRPPAASAAVATTPVASVKQIMKGIVDPASKVVFSAVNTVETVKGVEEIGPRTDAEWDTVGSNAAALIESGNMILAEGRAVDRGEWATFSKAMIESSQAALK